jgi:O-antigen/teichoic acid export membrane protein
MAASRFVNVVLAHGALKREATLRGIRIEVRHGRQEIGVFWRFSLPAALGGFMVVPVNWVCSAILVNQPQGYVEMGAYNAANQWYNVLMFLPTMLAAGLLPVMSDRMGDEDAESTGKLLKAMLLLNAGILVPAAAVFSALSVPLMKLYGNGYSDAWPTAIAVVWTAAIMGVLTPVGDLITASGRMWVGLAMNSGWAVVYVSSTVLLSGHGSLGLASSRLIAYLAHAVWTLGFAGMIVRHARARRATRGAGRGEPDSELS